MELLSRRRCRLVSAQAVCCLNETGYETVFFWRRNLIWEKTVHRLKRNICFYSFSLFKLIYSFFYSLIKQKIKHDIIIIKRIVYWVKHTFVFKIKQPRILFSKINHKFGPKSIDEYLLMCKIIKMCVFNKEKNNNQA